MSDPNAPEPRTAANPIGTGDELASRIVDELPYLRRYCRALTGSQESGDRYAAATLESILADQQLLDGGWGPRVALFRVFHTIWTGSGARVDGLSPGSSLGVAETKAQERLAALGASSREALLLRTIEEFRPDEVAHIMRISARQGEELVASALREMEAGVLGKVMVIEDEPLIAMDIRSIVETMGHSVTGIARTLHEALELGDQSSPDLILADIQLADNSSGIVAVNELLARLGEVPVVFITAFPERLLTGEKPEPAFLITKPFKQEQVRSAVSQAVFFASTETLCGPL